MSLLEEYINPIYLTLEGKERIKEDLKAKPNGSYVVLDHFFKEDILNKIVQEYNGYLFDPKADSIIANNLAPFDGAAAEADPDTYLGALLYSKEWYAYCLELLDMNPLRIFPIIKIRYNESDAKGYWIHNDKMTFNGMQKFCTILGYFNKGWKLQDGGLLQIWQSSPVNVKNIPSYEVEEYLDRELFLLEQNRINIMPYSEYWESNDKKDFILVDQIVPSYNRIVIFNLNDKALHHSVTPNKGRRRYGFIQWLSKKL
jgi:hypothetical protein